MNAGHLRRAGALGAAVALGSLGLAGTAAQAEQDGTRAESAKITMELEGKEIFFKGPNSVDAGSQLEIVNNTDPAEIGPHTFTLVEKDLIPELSKEAVKECYKEGVCASVFKAHKVDLEKETVGKKIARAGKEGWSVASAEGVTVALDTRLDAELELEGRVYDLIHTLNAMRREQGLELTDRISVTLPAADAELVERHAEWIKAEVLAVSLEVDSVEAPRIAKV